MTCKFIEKMKSCPKCGIVFKIAKCKIRFFETWVLSLNNLAIRFWMGLLFWKSATTKVIGEGTFGLPSSVDIFGYKFPLVPMPYEISESTYMLFNYEYNVPYLSAEFAAMSSTFAEIFLSLMLFFGFGARIAAFGFIVMTAVIHFTYEAYTDHYLWVMLLAVILTAGPGNFSLDHCIRKCFLGSGSCKK